jgi:hypothetical protein
MPCSEKWMKNTARRRPLTLRGGIGQMQGAPWRGEHGWDVGRYVVYQPGCPPITVPGVYLSHTAMQDGLYAPYSVHGAYPCHPWWQEPNPGCKPHGSRVCGPESTALARLHEPVSSCARDAPCAGGCCHPPAVPEPAQPPAEGMGRRRSRKRSKRLPALRKSYGPPRNRIGMGAPAYHGYNGGCDRTMGEDPSLTGCAAGTHPFGMYWGFARHHDRWPTYRRTSPFPVAQRPYVVGRSAQWYNEPFAGCPTRADCYCVENPC